MDLSSYRAEIDRIDREILSLYEERMETVRQLARYKQEKGIPIFRPERENEVLDRASEAAGDPYKTDVRVLFTTLMELSKFHQKVQIAALSPIALQIREALEAETSFPSAPRVACQGTAGAYSHIAAETLFPDGKIDFFRAFEDVFRAVDEGTVDYGILPLDNSSAGSVTAVYTLMKKYDFFINRGVRVKVEHCLAARPGVKLEEIGAVYSHEQALRQCSGFFEAHPGLVPTEFANTATAAKFVGESAEPAAAICSVKSAELYGLNVLFRGIQNTDENYTRFICISRTMQLPADANTVSIAVAIPNTPNSLYRLLTLFSAAGADLTKIESKPIGTKNFDVIFYIDFLGNLRTPEIFHLVNDLAGDFDSFKFLGNYRELAD